MNNKVLLWSVSLMLGVLSTSCSKDNLLNDEGVESDNICFAVDTNEATSKGAMFGWNKQPDDIGVFGYYDYNSIFLDNQKASGYGSYWSFTPAVKWSTPFLDIMTYAPYADKSTNGLDVEASEQDLIKIRYVAPVHADNQPDFIFSKLKSYKQKELVRLNYDHLLSAITFVIKSKTIDFRQYDADISMRYLYNTALLTIDYKDALSWSEFGFDEDTQYQMSVDDTITNEDDGYNSIQGDGYFMFLPQVLTGNALATITLTNKATLEKTEYYFRFVEFDEWVAGNYYKYNMEINK